jgi:hypothetical protein
MSRYLIIDTQGVPKNGETVFSRHGIVIGQALSEEETLEVFKEVWDRSGVHMSCPRGEVFNTKTQEWEEIKNWEEFKRTL